MKCLLKHLVSTAGLLAALAAAAPATQAQTPYGARTDGDWNNSTTWTPGGGPSGIFDHAYIATTLPGGSAATATVTLNSDVTVRSTAIGYEPGTSGTPDLNGNVLSAYELRIGDNGGTGSLVHNGGHFGLSNELRIYGDNTFAFGAADATPQMSVFTGATVTTAATSNLTTAVDVLDSGSSFTLDGGDDAIRTVVVDGSGSTLNLGAALDLTGSLVIQGGRAGVATVDADGHDITAGSIRVGDDPGGSGGALRNAGTITAGGLTVYAESSVLLTGGDHVVLSSLAVTYGGALDVEQAIGELTGLTLEGDSLSLARGSPLTLAFDDLLVEDLDWAFRWANPSGSGDRVATLMDFVADGAITWSVPLGGVGVRPRRRLHLHRLHGRAGAGAGGAERGLAAHRRGLARLAAPTCELRWPGAVVGPDVAGWQRD